MTNRLNDVPTTYSYYAFFCILNIVIHNLLCTSFIKLVLQIVIYNNR